jgi:N-acetylglucosamine-6-phosphate deacetylase
MSSVLVKNGRLIRKHTVEPADLLVDSGRIAAIGKNLTAGQATLIDAQGMYVAPGFIDIHIHGAGGSDFMDGGAESVKTILDTVLPHGTTSLLPTLMSEPLSRMRQAIEAIADSEDPRILGIYIEGPFFSEEKKGAQPAAHLLAPDVDSFQALIDGFTEKIKVVSLAPELPGGLDLVGVIVRSGMIAALGHSNASFSQAMAAIDAGVSQFTHFYNGMSSLHHRNPGAVGAGLLATTTTLELIADGIHVHPRAIELMVKTRGIDYICLITDAVRATGMPDGKYTLAGQEIFVQDGIARLVDGESLAGSTLTMEKAVRNMVQFGFPLHDVVRAATFVPACRLGVDTTKGSIAVGKDADLVVLNEDMGVEYVLIGGELRYEGG